MFNSDKIWRSYSDFYFGVTFFGTQCIYLVTLGVSVGQFEYKSTYLFTYLDKLTARGANWTEQH